ncbi:hypothetical protein CR513_32986, partial [Mucuna pruriens]
MGSTSSDSDSDENHRKGDTFTVSYLINSSGLSPKLAWQLSNRVNLKTPDGPNAVLDLLNNYRFSKTQLAKLIVRHPLVLVANAENTLLPKLKFFRSIGVSNSDMPKILITNHNILKRNLEKCLIPRYEILKSVVCNDGKVVRASKNAPLGFVYGDLVNELVPNIKILRQYGVPLASISLLVTNALSAAYVEHSRFVEAVMTVKEIGFSPLKTNFVIAIQVLVIMRKVPKVTQHVHPPSIVTCEPQLRREFQQKAVWKSRFEVYERWGWNREMSLRALRKFPCFMKFSGDTFTKKMSFLVKDMGWPSEAIAEYPQVVAYSLEKRIVPRFSVIKILKSKGLPKNNMHFPLFAPLRKSFWRNLSSIFRMFCLFYQMSTKICYSILGNISSISVVSLIIIVTFTSISHKMHILGDLKDNDSLLD